jgi:starvation-inducible outer membrane lipoprotein
MKHIATLALIASIGLTGCVTQPIQQKSALELQSYQNAFTKIQQSIFVRSNTN